MIAFVFPGQGSQKVGMGVDLAAASAAAREVFEEVDEALGQKLFALMAEGPEDELTRTANAQPAIMAHSIAVARVLEQDFGVKLAQVGEAVAGHSLGEYSALTAVGAFGLADAARLLRVRGDAMQAAVPVGVGGMCALLGADLEKAQALADAAAQGEVCEVANDNDPGQVVLSGHAGAIARAVDLAKEYGCKRAVPLPVSAPFHCSLMQPAADAMAEALAKCPPKGLLLPVYANFTAALVSDPAEELDLLVKQVTGRVRWRESMAAMGEAGITRFVELGGKVVGPMIRKIVPDSTQDSLVSMAEIEALAKEIA
ncbi:ACP S-malonyltransferase [Alteraurantiacibacter buctensis]|uniref:Malonyl CoA-acyl carrier protein transacylase n=1 Tax=Alteraurantiacibacter buctensis TaxID=1503981 RepID=A0A844YVI4_9SPHN|nr:ACP S-malonyltransferase [Alteraurantiacibacter buctensis]MXO71549.1 ACP S-malonyltransferase [Alteraurantiacibacter buctensis]